MPSPNIRFRGLRSPRIPRGYLLGRNDSGDGEVQLLGLQALRRMGLAGRNDVAAVAAALAATPNKAGFSAEGLLAPTELLGEWQFPGPRSFDDTNPSTTLTVLVAPAADMDLPLYSNATGPFVQVGHLHWTAGAYTGSLVLISNPLTLPTWARMRLFSPASPDTTASDFYGLIVGTAA